MSSEVLQNLAGRWVTFNSEDDKEDFVFIASDGTVTFAGAPPESALKLEERPDSSAASPQFVLREVSDEDNQTETSVVATVALEEKDDGMRVLKLSSDDGTTEEWHATTSSPKSAEPGKIVTRKKGGMSRVWTKEGQAGAAAEEAGSTEAGTSG
mmetsp:Transcript_65879/g.122970  ORF Transcript_65879/g.122970 Transcript_65879/m.122970 type:complete len:154 (-) Transcript_65879:41-502(-)